MLAAARKHKPRRAGRHAAPQHAAPGRGPREDRQARACSARSPTSRSAATTTCGPTATRPTQPVPDHLDYEMWTGPAPLRPYDGLPHKRWWRTFMEYGNGIIGDMCIHMLDMIRWLLDLGWPTRISSDRRHPRAEGRQVEHRRHADRHVRLRRPAGRLAAPHLGQPARSRLSPGPASSTATKERSSSSVHRYDFIPHGQEGADHQRHGRLRPAGQVPRGQDRGGHWRQHAASPPTAPTSATSSPPSPAAASPIADIEQGHISTASCILANLSMQLGRSLTWDPAKHEVVGDAEANKLLARPYRKPWVHPEVT